MLLYRQFCVERLCADEEIVDWAEIDEMLLIVIWNTTSKTSNTIITGMLFDFFPYFSVPVPS